MQHMILFICNTIRMILNSGLLCIGWHWKHTMHVYEKYHVCSAIIHWSRGTRLNMVSLPNKKARALLCALARVIHFFGQKPFIGQNSMKLAGSISRTANVPSIKNHRTILYIEQKAFISNHLRSAIAPHTGYTMGHSRMKCTVSNDDKRMACTFKCTLASDCNTH